MTIKSIYVCKHLFVYINAYMYVLSSKRSIRDKYRKLIEASFTIGTDWKLPKLCSSSLDYIILIFLYYKKIPQPCV